MVRIPLCRAMAARADLPTPHDSPALQSQRASWLAPLVILLAILATYWAVCSFDFTNWDDQLNVTANIHLNPPTGEGALYFWAHPYAHEYIPLSYTLWWLLARVARLDAPDAKGIWLNPYIFHSANLLLHIGVCLVVYQLLRRLTNRAWAACAGALFFGLHPLQVEAVAWATGLKDLLCGFLSMLALWQYIEFARADFALSSAHAGREKTLGAGGRSWRYVAATAALISAMLAKPSAISVPVIALVIDRLLLRRPWRPIAVAILPWLVAAAIFAAIGLASQPAGDVVNSPIWARPLIAADSLTFYLRKIVLPAHLAALYPHSASEILSNGELQVAWLLPAGMAVLAWLLRRRAPWLFAGALIFAAAPLPVLGLVPFHYQRFSTVADRYAYVAMLGPSLALAFALASLSAKRPRLPIWIPAICAALFIALGVLSARQAQSWRDTGTLFSRVLQVDPSSDVAYCDLASDALATGRIAEAETLARHAYSLKPDRTNNGLTLAAALEAQGRHNEAAGYYRDVLRLDPNDVTALTGLVYELATSGRAEEAMALCRRALAVDPSFPAAHRDMAMLLSQSHQDQPAVAEAAEAVRLDPMTAVNHVVYAKMLEAVGRKSEAADQASAARALDPNGNGAAGSSPPNH